MICDFVSSCQSLYFTFVLSLNSWREIRWTFHSGNSNYYLVASILNFTLNKQHVREKFRINSKQPHNSLKTVALRQKMITQNPRWCDTFANTLMNRNKARSTKSKLLRQCTHTHTANPHNFDNRNRHRFGTRPTTVASNDALGKCTPRSPKVGLFRDFWQTRDFPRENCTLRLLLMMTASAWSVIVAVKRGLSGARFGVHYI